MVRLVRFGLCLTVSSLLAATAVAAVWSGGRGPGYRGAFPDQPLPASPAVVWKAWLGTNFSGLQPSNALVSHGVVIVAYSKLLLALTTETGEIRWFQDLGDMPIGDLLLLDGQIVISYGSGRVEARNPVDGTVVWKADLTGGIRNGPVVTDTALFFATRANAVESIQRKTGKLAGVINAGNKIDAGPAILARSRVLCYRDGKVIRVEDGVILWSITLPNAVVSLTPVTDGRLVVINGTNAFYAVNPNDDNTPMRWSYAAMGGMLPEPAVIDGGRVYLATRDARLVSLDLATGRDRWTRTEILTENGKQIKKELAGIPLLGMPVANPIIFGSSVLVRMEHGLIQAFQKDTGAPQWSFRLETTAGATPPTLYFSSLPAIEGDQMYLAGSDGSIYRLSSTAPDPDPPVFSDVLPKLSDKGIIEAANVQYVGAIIKDEGAGLMQGSVTIQLDRDVLTSELKTDAKSGYFYYALDPKTPIEGGMHRLTITAKDNRGNVGKFDLNFIVGSEAADMVPIKISGEFLPKRLRVKPGSIIRWTNAAGSPRTVIADTLEGDKPVFSSDNQFPDGIPMGETWSWIVPATTDFGTHYYYHCRLKGQASDGEMFGKGLVGVIEVVENPTEPVIAPANPANPVAPVAPGPPRT